MRRIILWAPLAAFVVFVILVTFYLRAPSDTSIRSHLVGRPLPAFALQAAVPSHPGLGTGDLRTGRPRMLNVFASWCGPCVVEAPQLMALRRRGVPIDAIAIRDRSEDVAAFLARYGDPFERIGSDPNTQVQIALGSSGVPETFVIDGRGTIRYQHIGPIAESDLPALIAAWEAAR
ncbi:MAG: cytochrome c biosis protein CcmG, thiol:disulfide interchange protein DsbE [Sphingomonadales bacterium]|jgi:cytochrome c biogenesis protein CcmG/thiol:disulfide interchange protein DsbE|nr:cytochrome c biosis protein CcmG, thiol:disulfide interchange protein DsbE [Sphingomonadales bacterium]